MTESSKRVVFTMGGKGGVGKTGVVVALAEWFHANEIPVTLLDLDTENKARGSLKHFFDGTVTKVDVHTPAGLDAFIDHLDGGTPIILADMGTGAGQVAADWFDSMYEDVAATGVRFTAVGVVTPDPASVESVLTWANRLQDRVEYVIVENATSALADFTYWRSTKQANQFREALAPAILEMEFRLAELENPLRQHGIQLGQVAERKAVVDELNRASLVMRAQSYRAAALFRIRPRKGDVSAMSAAPAPQNLEINLAGEPTTFDSLARLVPDELRAAYYRVLAHTHTLSPDDEMLRILEAMGILALLTRNTPKDIAVERERFQELLEVHRHYSDEALQMMLGYVKELDTRVSDLPKGIKAGIDPQQIAKMLGESLRQHFLQSGVRETVEALQVTAGAMAGAQQKLTRALMELLDNRGGVVAQVQSANSRLLDSLEYRAGKLDSLIHEFKSDLLRIWMPIVTGAALLSGLFLGMLLQAHRDSDSATGTAPTQAVQSVPTNGAKEGPTTGGTIRKEQSHNRVATLSNAPP